MQTTDKNQALDSYDRKIIEILSAQGRMPVTELAKKIGTSKSPCQVRLKRLEKNGFITGYRAILNPRKLNKEHVCFVEVKLTDTRESSLMAFNKKVLEIPEIEQCHMIASSFDYLLKIRTVDIKEYRAVLGDKISTLPNVASTSTFVVMEAVKDSAF